MTKQQLTRLFIVIAAAAAIVFVPYWAGEILPPFAYFDDAELAVVVNWLYGSVAISALSIITLLFFHIIPTIYKIIKNGK